MVWDIDNINVTPAELALLRELETVAPGSLVCLGSKYRTAKRLQGRRLCDTASPEAKNSAAFRLLSKGVKVLAAHRPPVTAESIAVPARGPTRPSKAVRATINLLRRSASRMLEAASMWESANDLSNKDVVAMALREARGLRRDAKGLLRLADELEGAP